jgi:hypothetical protein
MRKKIVVIILLLLLGGAGIRYYYYSTQATLPPRTSSQPTPPEYPVTVIPLAGAASDSDAELSSLAWYGEHLILVPQYPQRFDNQLFALPKADILSFLDGNSNEPLTPLEIPLKAPDLSSQIAGFQGFEAIGFIGEQVFITIEAESGGAMVAYLLRGSIAPDLSQIELDSNLLVDIAPQSDIANESDESLFIADDRVMTLYEGNGRNVNPSPKAHQFESNLTPLDTIMFPNIEYRITDATALDGANRFWVINYLFPGSINKLKPAPDPLFTDYGVGATHAQNQSVERLLELEYSPTGITFTDRAPIQLQLSDKTRNWEGIVRLEERGFLLATDKFPETILGFVEVMREE